MKLGIFAKTFARPSVDRVLEAVKRHGLDAVQFNLSCAGLPSLPEERIDPEQCRSIRRLHEAYGLELAALSGTFNMAHPDPRHRAAGLERLRVLAEACAELGASVITLCTGTRDPGDMWRGHPDNRSPEAWAAMADTVAKALAIAEPLGLTLAVEPEQSNVVSDARLARRLLDEMQSRRLRIVMDAANLYDPAAGTDLNAVMEEAFGLLGGDLAVAHAKDVRAGGQFAAAGQGIVDYDRYLRLLDDCGFRGALVLHGLAEEEVDASVRFLRRKRPFG